LPCRDGVCTEDSVDGAQDAEAENQRREPSDSDTSSTCRSARRHNITDATAPLNLTLKHLHSDALPTSSSAPHHHHQQQQQDDAAYSPCISPHRLSEARPPSAAPTQADEVRL